ncbi:MAG: T9SS type A sorting domain-containing protein [Ignavibacteriota bacterium]
MRRLILISVFASLMVLTDSIFVNSQPVTWVKIIGDSVKSMSGISVVQTYDGGYAVLAVKGVIAGDQKLLLFKLDNLGNLIWKKTLGDTSLSLYPIKLVQTNDSGFVVLGLQIGNFLMKTDKNGNFLWRKNYPDTALAEARLYGFTKTYDNGFILCGNYTSFSPTLENGYLIKTDSVGNVKWQKGFHDSTSNNYFDIMQFPDNNYYVAGYTSNSASNRYAITKKFKNNGEVIWTKLLLNPSGSFLITKVLNDKIAIVSNIDGGGPSNVSLLDTSSNLIWQYNYSYPAFSYSINPMPSGSIIITGGVEFGGYDATIAMKKLSLDGDSISAKNFLYQGYSHIGAKNTANTNDNGFILTGGATVNNKSNILIIKTDSSFNAPIITNISYSHETTPNSFELYQNYPNPFNPSTSIKFNIPENGFVKIKIFDLSGKEVLKMGNQYCFKGLNKFIFDAIKYNLSSGIYFFSIEFKEQIKSTKLVYLK